jgi:hypothetical protein
MMLVKTPIACALVVLAVGYARADWQYTRWGMSPDELISKGNGTVVEASPREKFIKGDFPNGQRGPVLDVRADAALKSGYRAQEILYTAVYFFLANRLVAVSLFPPTAEDGVRTGKAIENIYGPPEREQRMWCLRSFGIRARKHRNAQSPPARLGIGS